MVTLVLWRLPEQLGFFVLQNIPSTTSLFSPVSAFSPRQHQARSPPVSSSLFNNKAQRSAAEEPRRRAPRALTGRHVRSGTGASRATLEILRKKIVERMRLKELLGENSHIYFGALNKQQKKNSANKNAAGAFAAAIRR